MATQLEKIVNIIKTHGKKDVGPIQTNSKGVKYQYTSYFLKTPFHWVVKTFEKAQEEVYAGKRKHHDYDYQRIKKDNIQIHCGYSPYKGQGVRDISLSELEIF